MRSSASGGALLPTDSISPSRRSSQPSSCSLPASSIVATYAFASNIRPTRRPYNRAPLAATASPFYSRLSVDRDGEGVSTTGRKTMRKRKYLLAGVVVLLGVATLALATSVSA